jgi:hypothetical protein
MTDHLIETVFGIVASIPHVPTGEHPGAWFFVANGLCIGLGAGLATFLVGGVGILMVRFSDRLNNISREREGKW